MAQALCFGQIGFAASERLFRSFSLRGVPPYPDPVKRPVTSNTGSPETET